VTPNHSKQADGRYQVTYTYDNPSPAGPYKGRWTVDRRYQRGEGINAPFGRATVKSCRRIKEDPVERPPAQLRLTDE